MTKKALGNKVAPTPGVSTVDTIVVFAENGLESYRDPLVAKFKYYAKELPTKTRTVTIYSSEDVRDALEASKVLYVKIVPTKEHEAGKHSMTWGYSDDYHLWVGAWWNKSWVLSQVAQEILALYFRLGWGWVAHARSGAQPPPEQEHCVKPYPWGGSVTKAPRWNPELGERSGWMALFKLPRGRVITQVPVELPECIRVSYGCSGLDNVAELLQALKVGHTLGIPVIFDTYESAGVVQTYVAEALIPSLSVLSSDLPELVWAGKATQHIPKDMCPTLTTILGSSVLVTPTETDTIASWYRTIMESLATYLQQSLRLHIPISFQASEDLFLTPEVGAYTVVDLAGQVTQAAKHGVSLFSSIAGSIRTNAVWITEHASQTISQIHSEGYWLGGASLYWVWYRWSNSQPFVAMIKDTSAGNVHLLARPYMTGDTARLWVAPVSGLRIFPKGANPAEVSDSSEGRGPSEGIDLLVFLELLQRWGTEKSHNVLQTIWDLIEFPLTPQHIGKVPWVWVNLDGIEVEWH